MPPPPPFWRALSLFCASVSPSPCASFRARVPSLSSAAIFPSPPTLSRSGDVSPSPAMTGGLGSTHLDRGELCGVARVTFPAPQVPDEPDAVRGVEPASGHPGGSDDLAVLCRRGRPNESMCGCARAGGAVGWGAGGGEIESARTGATRREK